MAALAQAATQYRVDYRLIAAAEGYRPEDVARLFEEYGYEVPRFAVGTDYVPKDMLAYIHEGEKIVPKAYNPAANPGMAGGNSELVAAVIRLTEQNAAMASRLEAIESNTRGLQQMVDQFDTVADSGRLRTVPA